VTGQIAGHLRSDPRMMAPMRHFFTGQVIKTELLVDWLEKHGIEARQEWVEPDLPDDGDLGREARVLVSEAHYDRAYQLFFAEREDEL
jgi:hypothetical protein